MDDQRLDGPTSQDGHAKGPRTATPAPAADVLAGREPAEAAVVDGAPTAPQAADPVPEGAEPAPATGAYVRPRTAHRSVEPIDDLADDIADDEAHVSHDSEFALSGSPISGHGYRRSRHDGQQLRQDLHYGQYLEVPKGRRDIFVKRDRAGRRRTIAVVAVLVVALVALLAWALIAGPLS